MSELSEDAPGARAVRRPADALSAVQQPVHGARPARDAGTLPAPSASLAGAPACCCEAGAGCLLVRQRAAAPPAAAAADVRAGKTVGHVGRGRPRATPAHAASPGGR